MSEPLVVVGIVTHNRAQILPKAIGSALQQNYQPLRVAVIDDASTDDTPSVRAEFPAVSWERREKGEGYLKARNHMMLRGHDDYYVSLDDDAWFIGGDEIALAVAFLELHREVAAIAFDVLSPDQPARNERGVDTLVSLFIGCGHMLRLSVVRELQGYREFPRTYGGEEMDLCMRLIDRGHRIVRMGGVHVWHEKAMTARDLSRQHSSGVCNDLTLTVRRIPIGLVVPLVGYKLASHFAFALRNNRVKACLQGMRDFVVALPDAWRHRDPISYASFSKYHALARAPRRFGG